MKWRLDHGQIEVVDEIMVPFLRVKTPAERIEMAAASHELAREMIAARLQSLNPDWNAERLEAEVARRLLGGST